MRHLWTTDLPLANMKVLAYLIICDFMSYKDIVTVTSKCYLHR